MMKFVYLCLFAVGLMGLTACSDNQPNAKDMQAMLAEQKFAILSLNGTSFSSMQDQSLYLEFDKDLKLSGHICNQFSGAATLKDTVLQVKQLASTNMLCSDEINGIEDALFSLLEKGASVAVVAEKLTLSTQGVTGEVPVVQTVEGQKPAEQQYIFVLQRENSVVAK